MAWEIIFKNSIFINLSIEDSKVKIKYNKIKDS